MVIGRWQENMRFIPSDRKGLLKQQSSMPGELGQVNVPTFAGRVSLVKLRQ